MQPSPSNLDLPHAHRCLLSTQPRAVDCLSCRKTRIHTIITTSSKTSVLHKPNSPRKSQWPTPSFSDVGKATGAFARLRTVILVDQPSSGNSASAVSACAEHTSCGGRLSGTNGIERNGNAYSLAYEVTCDSTCFLTNLEKGTVSLME